MMRDFSKYYYYNIYIPPILLLKYIYLVSAWQLPIGKAYIQSSNSSHLWSLLTERNVGYNVLCVCLRWKWIILAIILFITLFSLKESSRRLNKRTNAVYGGDGSLSYIIIR